MTLRLRFIHEYEDEFQFAIWKAAERRKDLIDRTFPLGLKGDGIQSYQVLPYDLQVIVSQAGFAVKVAIMRDDLELAELSLTDYTTSPMRFQNTVQGNLVNGEVWVEP